MEEKNPISTDTPTLWSKLTTPTMITVWKILGVVLLVVAVGLAIWKVTNSSGSQIAEVLQQYKTQLLESHADIEELNHLVEEERTAREALESSFNTRLTEIDQRYSTALDEIRRTRTVRQREIIERPTELGSRFSETFGISGATP
jgi:LPS O-antigen subunit length determinant protein (WzzB/FepE family)